MVCTLKYASRILFCAFVLIVKGDQKRPSSCSGAPSPNLIFCKLEIQFRVTELRPKMSCTEGPCTGNNWILKAVWCNRANSDRGKVHALQAGHPALLLHL